MSKSIKKVCIYCGGAIVDSRYSWSYNVSGPERRSFSGLSPFHCYGSCLEAEMSFQGVR